MQKAILAAKNDIEENLCKELNPLMVAVPLIVDVESGVNDMLDRDGARTQRETANLKRHPAVFIIGVGKGYALSMSLSS